MGIDPGQTLCTQLSGTHRAKRTFASLRRRKLSSGDFRAKRNARRRGIRCCPVHKATRERARTPKESTKREQRLAWIALECGACSHRLCAMPPATANRATRRDSYCEARCLRIGPANRSRPRDNAQLRLTPKGFGVEGKSEFNERGTSDEDDN